MMKLEALLFERRVRLRWFDMLRAGPYSTRDGATPTLEAYSVAADAWEEADAFDRAATLRLFVKLATTGVVSQVARGRGKKNLICVKRFGDLGLAAVPREVCGCCFGSRELVLIPFKSNSLSWEEVVDSVCLCRDGLIELKPGEVAVSGVVAYGEEAAAMTQLASMVVVQERVDGLVSGLTI